MSDTIIMSDTGDKREQNTKSLLQGARKQQNPGLEKLHLREGDKNKLESGYWSFNADSFTSNNCKSNRSSNVDVNEIPETDKQSKNADSSTNKIQQLLLCLETLQAQGPSRDLVGKYVERETFAAAFLSNEGGIIKISEKHVTLYVPPGALPEDSVQLVYVSIIPPETRLPVLPTKEKWITPIVDCGPPGLKFQRSVLLSLPRISRRKSKHGHQITVRRSTPSSDYQWDRLADGDTDRLKGRVLIRTIHFTRFGVSEVDDESEDEEECTLSSTWKKVAAFVKPSENHDSRLEIIVKLCDLKTYKDEIRDKSFAIPTRNSTPAPSLLVWDSKSKVVIRLLDVKGSWTIVGDVEKTLDCANIALPDHQRAPLLTSVTFTVENLQKEATFDFKGTLEVYQENNPDEKIGTLVQYPSLTEDTKRADSDDEDIKFLMQQPDLDPSPHSNCFIKDRRFREICIILEGMNDVGMMESGWRSLAQAIGIVKYVTLSSIEGRARYQHKSPSTIVLDYFFSQRQNTKEELISDALRYLSNVFQDMQNADAKRLVEEELSERCLHNDIDNTKHSSNCYLNTTDEIYDGNDNFTLSKRRSPKKLSRDSQQTDNQHDWNSSAGFAISQQCKQKNLISTNREPDLESVDEKLQGQVCCFSFLKRGRHTEEEVLRLPTECEYSNRDSGYGTVLGHAKQKRKQKYSLSLNSIDAAVENSV